MKADIASCDLRVSAGRCDDEYARFVAGRGQKCVRRGAADCVAMAPGSLRTNNRLRTGMNTSSAGQR